MYLLQIMSYSKMFHVISSEDDYNYAVHHRDLGEKEGEMYVGALWSDVTINGVPLDDTLDLEIQDKAIESMNSFQERGSEIIVNDRKVNASVLISSSEHGMVDKYNSKYRVKKIKKYPTKPIYHQIDKEHKEVLFQGGVF